jgi:hypothetical protein
MSNRQEDEASDPAAEMDVKPPNWLETLLLRLLDRGAHY